MVYGARTNCGDVPGTVASSVNVVDGRYCVGVETVSNHGSCKEQNIEIPLLPIISTDRCAYSDNGCVYVVNVHLHVCIVGRST